MSRHNQIWTALVIAWGFFCAVGIATMLFVMETAAARPDYKPGDTAIFKFVISIYGLNIFAIAVTLTFRFLNPPVGRILTKALNIIFLFAAFPITTAIGIYGLWKVDRSQ